MAESAETLWWAAEEFGRADVGHGARLTRLVRLGAQLAKRPGGKVTEVCKRSADREAAYRALENPAIKTSALVEAIGAACVARSAEFPFVYVPVDGSSLTLTDRARTKDFGAIGSDQKGARGVKVMSTLAVSPSGVPLGIPTLEWWTRDGAAKRPHPARKTHEKETQRWLDAITHTAERMGREAPKTKCWFQLDREADAWPTLRHLVGSSHWFTVRSSRNRRLAGGTTPTYLREHLQKQRPLGEMRIEIKPNHDRGARTAFLVVRAATVTLELRDQWTNARWNVTLQAVWACERTTENGEKPLDWLLLTNREVGDLEDAALVVTGYCQRWRIEEFHRTWKSGACNVEDSQLRSIAALTKWATLHASVAARIERLKQLARTQRETSADVELTSYEIRALVLWKAKNKKRAEPAPPPTPTIGQAVTWIAEMGGYIGKSSGGPPGSITIARGLEQLRAWADALEALESSRAS
jgi:hypothetical protein